MAFIPTGNTVEVFMDHLAVGVEGKGWVFHFERDEPVNVAGMEDLAALLVTWWKTEIAPLISNGVQLQRVKMRDISTLDSFVLDYTTGLPDTGDVTGDKLPLNAALCLKLATNLAGRSHRGRMYWFGLAESQVTDNYVALAVVDAIETAVNTLKGDYLPGSGWTWVVTSFQYQGEPRSEGQNTPIANVVAVDNRVDTQRRRLP